MSPAASSRHVLRLTVLLALLLALVPAVAAQAVAAPRPTELSQLAPALAVRLAGDAARPVDIIVRASGSLDPLAALVRQLGGEVRAEHRFINALSATIAAGLVEELAVHRLVQSVSFDAPLQPNQIDPPWASLPLDPARLQVAYNHAIGATQLWTRPSGNLRGNGVTVAVLDSGFNPQADIYSLLGRNRHLEGVSMLTEGWDTGPWDFYGHGDHVTGIIAGNGRVSNYSYVGVAPEANVVSVRVLDSNGVGTLSGMIRGLEWIYNNRERLNIRVVNISINSAEPESYRTSPLSAAVQALWFSGVVVVVSAGNAGEEALYPPANDPFVITVGASDDKGTATTADDTMARFSAWGRTVDGIRKPDLVAPGTNIVATMYHAHSMLKQTKPDYIVNGSYFRMSGTSMAAPMVSGAVALLLQAEPTLSPDQVKFRLMATARRFSTPARAGAGHLDVFAAVTNPNRVSGQANQGLVVNDLLAGSDTGMAWNTTTSGSVSWRGRGTAFFSSVSWRGRTTGTSASTYWGP